MTASQLRAAGFDGQAVKRRLRSGRLHRLHRGVYLVGHGVAPEGAVELAAVLACGDGSAVSHRSAARLCSLPLFREWREPVDIAVPGRAPRHRPGIVVHRVRVLAPRDVRRVDGIPTTSPARTLLDLAGLISFPDMEVTLADARALGLVTDRDLREVVERCRTHRGTGVLRRLLELHRDRGLSRSEAERKLFALVKAAELPLPKKNVYVRRRQVDFLWRREKLVVEVDGYAYHSSKRSFEQDRKRDAQLEASGYAVIRVTWGHLTASPEAVVGWIAAALAVRSR